MSSTGSLGAKPPTAWQRMATNVRAFLTAKRNVNEVRQAAAFLPARKVYVNMAVPDESLAAHAEHFCTNAITTAQYSLINFLPKNLSRQFMRVANVYFLVLTILQLISYFSLGSRFLTVVPIILVLAITAAKDGFEDWRRHISDRHFNETPTRIVRNLRNTNLKWQDDQALIAEEKWSHRMRISMARRLEKRTLYNQIPPDWEESQNPVDATRPPVLDEEAKWRNVRIGDFVILRTGDPAPADMLMLATSADDGSCYVETKNLDGETNLKPRASLAETAGVRDAEGCGRVKAIVEVDPPTSDMTKINGSIRVFAVPEPPVEDEPTPPYAEFAAQGFSATAPMQTSSSGPPAEGYGMPESNSFEMRQLNTLRQAMPMKHSPLAKAITKPATMQSYGADDAKAGGVDEAADNMATVVNKNPAR
ncbi:hypothetical protein EC988_002147 [Linderina pennispora]|nr:hypothetical protein EC988_002147 [Linderina pennispora]